jgi:hypothetical protein
VSSERVLPTPWQLTAGDLAKLCGQPVPPPPPTRILVPDVEGLCRGALADAQRRGVLARDIEPGDWAEVLGFLLGEVVVHARKYDPARRGIEFRPWLYERIRAFSVVDACRWLYGRQGQHRVAGEGHLEQARDDAGFDVHDGASFDSRLGGATLGDETDRVDARRWLDAAGDRYEPAPVGGRGLSAGRGAAAGDRSAGARQGFGVARGAGLEAYWVDCVACGWRTFVQPPNGIDVWHVERCSGCGADLTGVAA